MGKNKSLYCIFPFFEMEKKGLHVARCQEIIPSLSKMMRHFKNAGLVRTVYSGLFRTLGHLEPEVSSKVSQTCSMIGHIQSLGIVRTVYWSKDIQGYWCIFINTGRRATRGGGGGKDFPRPFLKIKKGFLILEKVPDFVHLWVNFSIQNVVWRVSTRKNFKMLPCGASFSWVFDENVSTKLPCPEKFLVARLQSGIILFAKRSILNVWQCSVSITVL